MAALERLDFAFADTTFGRLLLARSERGLVWLSFVDEGKDEAALDALARRYPRSELVRTPESSAFWVTEAVEEAESLGAAAAAGHPRTALDLRGTPFQREVWDALLAIPYGQTRSYGEIARAIGRPAAVRAVAQACGANPVGVIVPCHRVIGSDGSLTGYAGGLDHKRALLDAEAADSRG